MCLCCCAEGKSILLSKGSNADSFSYTRNMLLVSSLIIDKCRGMLFFAYGYFLWCTLSIHWNGITDLSACCPIISPLSKNLTTKWKVRETCTAWRNKWDQHLKFYDKYCCAAVIRDKDARVKAPKIAYWGTQPKDLIGFVDRDDPVYLIPRVSSWHGRTENLLPVVRENEAEVAESLRKLR